MRLLSVIVALSLLPSTGFAEEQVIQLNYRSAIERALAKNFEIKIEEFSPRIARAQQQSASGRFDPTLQLSYEYEAEQNELRTLSTDLNIDQTTGDGTLQPLFIRRDGDNYNGSIIGLTPWGLTYDLEFNANRDGDTRQEFDRFDTFLGLTLVQPLLRGFGTDVNLSSIRIARADRAISEWQLRASVINVLTRTITTYNDLWFAINNLRVEERSRALAGQLLQNNIKRAEIGVMSPLDVVQAQADLAAREERVLVAERLLADTENFLKQLVTDELSDFLDTRVEIAPPPDISNQFDIDVRRDVAVALEQRPDFRQALLDLQKDRINVVFTRNQVLPQLDLVASFGINGVDTDFLASTSNLQEAKNVAWSAGATFELPVPNREARGNRDEAQLTVAQALVDLKRLEQSIIVGVDNAAGQVETTAQRIKAASAARRFAAQTLAAGEVRLSSGTATTFEVLQFQRDLATAEIAELQAIVDHNKALAEYAQQTATTLERSGVIIAPEGATPEVRRAVPVSDDS